MKKPTISRKREEVEYGLNFPKGCLIEDVAGFYIVGYGPRFETAEKALRWANKKGIAVTRVR